MTKPLTRKLSSVFCLLLSIATFTKAVLLHQAVIAFAMANPTQELARDAVKNSTNIVIVGILIGMLFGVIGFLLWPIKIRKFAMKLHVLYAQRKERYPGEYAPEALAVIDEAGLSDNPEYMSVEKNTAIATGEFESVVVVTLDVNGGKIMEMLRPTAQTLQAEIV